MQWASQPIQLSYTSPWRMSGLNLLSLSALYKQLQVLRQCQLLTSADACVQHLAEKHLQNEDRLSRKSFKQAVIVHDALADDPGRNRKALSLGPKRKVKDSEAKERGTATPKTRRNDLCHLLRNSICMGQSSPSPTLQRHKVCSQCRS